VAGYSLEIKRSAIGEIEAVSTKNDRRRVVARIRALAKEPRPPGCEKLSGHRDRYRVRQGSYRVVYSIDDAKRIVLIVKVGHRREIYRTPGGRS
jgi:mRNA interferase RelE/StbE